MSKVQRELRELGQARTLSARVWLVGRVLVYLSAAWWLWSESAANRFATGMAFVFAASWLKDGAARPRDFTPAPEDAAPVGSSAS